MAKKIILVVEDDIGVRKVLKRFLSTMDIDMVESADTKTALKECAARKFDLVMMDYNITGGEVGWRIVKELRAKKNVYGVPKTLLVSGTVDPESTVRSLGLTSAEVDAHLRKPFDLDQLREVLERLLDL